MQSRREFLGRAGAVLGTALPRGAVEVMIADAVLLAELLPGELRLVKRVIAAYPALPLAEAVAMLREAGM